MTDPGRLLGLTGEEAAQVLDAQQRVWTVRRCSSFRNRPGDCMERVVRARTLDDGTVEITLSGFCDHPRRGKETVIGQGQSRNQS